MKVQPLFALMLLCGVMACAQADDVQLNFSGTIKSPSCLPDPSSMTMDRQVSLGSVSTTVLGGPGDLSDPVDFDLVINCPVAGPGTATVQFSARADASDPTLIAIDGGDNSASGVAIRLEEENGTKLPLDQVSAARALVPGLNSLNYRARYQALIDRPGIVPGVANGTAQFTINYQ
ncbi:MULTISPECIES: fimbrial protein [Enterobacterales]|uniref:fimbrial protein n=1 Tax=Enterobacterales TaxID=91347 RepID=UPI002ED9A9F6